MGHSLAEPLTEDSHHSSKNNETRHNGSDEALGGARLSKVVVQRPPRAETVYPQNEPTSVLSFVADILVKNRQRLLGWCKDGRSAQNNRKTGADSRSRSKLNTSATGENS